MLIARKRTTINNILKTNRHIKNNIPKSGGGGGGVPPITSSSWDLLTKEFEINDVHLSARNILTKVAISRSFIYLFLVHSISTH